MKEFVFENKKFRLAVGENAIVKSLIFKETGEEMVAVGNEIALFSETQLRPFNNEVKLMYMNKRTTFQANRLEIDGNKITVGFEIVPWTAIVSFDIKDEYIAFTLEEVISGRSDLCTDLPPIEEFRILQIPVKNRKNFGHWINAVWDDEASVAVVSTMPEALADSEKRKDFRILTADAKKEIQLTGVGAALIVSGGKEDFLDAVDRLEHDYNLPLGVESRRSSIINRSIYSAGRACPANIDEHIKYAKMGGFSCMLMYYPCMCKIDPTCYGTTGDYDFNENYPNGFDDLKLVIKKIKDAGLIPGIHFLHTHIGMNSRYVTGKADSRLNLTMYFTLKRPLGLDDDKIYVEENPKNAACFDYARFAHLPHYSQDCHILKFGGELMSYQGFSTERPYHFYGVKRGHWNTVAEEHPVGEIGGQLDVTEYSGTSVYINQHTNLQEEVGAKLAAFYNCGFEFVYFDGSEGTNPPFEYHVPNAQYRVLKLMNNPPRFCEGAAKAHFSWHFVSGGNAFDAFKTPIFKKMIDKFPLAEAPDARQDFTRVNFGWWAFFNDTQKDVYEYGTSRAFSWDCPVTVSANLATLKNHPRVKDILEVLRRWEDARKTNFITDEEKELLKEPGKEYTLLINEEGKYELTPYFEVCGVGGEDSGISAFVFERRGRAYANLWHRTAEAKLSIEISDAIYERDLGKERLDIKKENGRISVTVSDSAYLSTDISLDELKKKLTLAKTV
jgi:hypothetical protein